MHVEGVVSGGYRRLILVSLESYHIEGLYRGIS